VSFSISEHDVGSGVTRRVLVRVQGLSARIVPTKVWDRSAPLTVTQGMRVTSTIRETHHMVMRGLLWVVPLSSWAFSLLHVKLERRFI
jgi:hypothetical protein